MDLAVIKPRWTTKHDFKVDLPKNKMLEEEQFDPQLEEPGSSLLRPDSAPPLQKLPSISTPLEKLMHAKRFEKVVLREFEENRLPDLKQTLQDKKKELEEEKRKFKKVKDRKRSEYEHIKSEMKRRDRRDHRDHRDHRERDHREKERDRDHNPDRDRDRDRERDRDRDHRHRKEPKRSRSRDKKRKRSRTRSNERRIRAKAKSPISEKSSNHRAPSTNSKKAVAPD